jgi:AcrR family transcriptional regulator
LFAERTITEMGEMVIGLREQSRREAARRIREAAVELLAERTIDEITTKEVAQRAGIGEATLFRHIPSKRALLILAYGDTMDSLLDEIERNDKAAAVATASEPTGHDFYQRVLAVLKSRSEFYMASPANASAYLRHAYDPQNLNPERNVTQGDRIIRLVLSILRAGQKANVLRDDIEPLRVAENCHGIFIHEVERTPVRGFDPADFWERLRLRLHAQLWPLIIDGSGPTNESKSE